MYRESEPDELSSEVRHPSDPVAIGASITLAKSATNQPNLHPLARLTPDLVLQQRGTGNGKQKRNASTRINNGGHRNCSRRPASTRIRGGHKRQRRPSGHSR